MPRSLGGCGGSGGARVDESAPEWRRYAGTLNFISENTAPTAAIVANLAPFKKLTGIDVKVVQLELAAVVQKVSRGRSAMPRCPRAPSGAPACTARA